MKNVMMQSCLQVRTGVKGWRTGWDFCFFIQRIFLSSIKVDKHCFNFLLLITCRLCAVMKLSYPQTDPPLYSRAVAYSTPMEHSALPSVADGQSQMMHNKRNGRYDDDYPTYQEQKKPMIGYPTKSLTQRRPLSARSYSTETYGASQVILDLKLLHILRTVTTTALLNITNLVYMNIWCTWIVTFLKKSHHIYRVWALGHRPVS